MRGKDVAIAWTTTFSFPPCLASFQQKEGKKSPLESYHPEMTTVSTVAPSLLCISLGPTHVGPKGAYRNLNFNGITYMLFLL